MERESFGKWLIKFARGRKKFYRYSIALSILMASVSTFEITLFHILKDIFIIRQMIMSLTGSDGWSSRGESSPSGWSPVSGSCLERLMQFFMASERVRSWSQSDRNKSNSELNCQWFHFIPCDVSLTVLHVKPTLKWNLCLILTDFFMIRFMGTCKLFEMWYLEICS